MKNRDLKKQLAAAIAMTIVATVALGSSTYAWFVSNSEVKAESTKLTAETTSSLLISQNTATPQWGTSIPLDDAEVLLSPVSTVGNLNAGSMEFFEANTFDTATGNGEYAAQTFKAVTPTEGDTNEKIFMDTFYIKSSEACNLQLSESTKFDVTGDDNVLDETLRLAFVVTDNKATPTAEKTFFYQVNADGDGIEKDTTLDASGIDGITNAIATTTTSGAITADNAVGGVPLLANHLLPATTATTDTAADTLYTFSGVEAEHCIITAYVWMEGCDLECNLANKDGLLKDANSILGHLGFIATTTTP